MPLWPSEIGPALIPSRECDLQESSFPRDRNPGRFKARLATIAVAHQMRHGHIVTTAEALPVAPSQLERNTRMPVLIAVVDVRTAVVLHIPARAFHSIPEATPLHLAELSRRRVPSTPVMVAHVSFRFPHSLRFPHRRPATVAIDMGNPTFVAATEALPVRLTQSARKCRTAVFVAVVDVRAAVVLVVLARALHSIVKSPALYLVVPPGSPTPAAAILKCWRRRRCAVCSGRAQTRGRQYKYKCRYSKPIRNHRTISFLNMRLYWIIRFREPPRLPAPPKKKKSRPRTSGAACLHFNVFILTGCPMSRDLTF